MCVKVLFLYLRMMAMALMAKVAWEHGWRIWVVFAGLALACVGWIYITILMGGK